MTHSNKYFLHKIRVAISCLVINTRCLTQWKPLIFVHNFKNNKYSVKMFPNDFTSFYNVIIFRVLLLIDVIRKDSTCSVMWNTAQKTYGVFDLITMHLLSNHHILHKIPHSLKNFWTLSSSINSHKRKFVLGLDIDIVYFWHNKWITTLIHYTKYVF